MDNLGIAAQCWCDKETSGIEVDARLATAFAKRLDEKDAEIAELINLSKPFARFHCQDKECKCHNCLLHRYITTLEKSDGHCI